MPLAQAARDATANRFDALRLSPIRFDPPSPRQPIRFVHVLHAIIQMLDQSPRRQHQINLQSVDGRSRTLGIIQILKQTEGCKDIVKQALGIPDGPHDLMGARQFGWASGTGDYVDEEANELISWFFSRRLPPREALRVGPGSPVEGHLSFHGQRRLGRAKSIRTASAHELPAILTAVETRKLARRLATSDADGGPAPQAAGICSWNLLGA